LLLIAGLSQWADQWWEFGYGDLLAAEYRLIAVDRLGHGASDKPRESELYDERLIADDLVAVLDAEEVERALVWGFSLGAKNAASLAVRHPERVAALVYGSGPALTRPDQNRQRYSELAEKIASPEGLLEVWQSVGWEAAQVDDALSHNDPAALAATVRGTLEWWPQPDDVTAPALWYVGAAEGGFYEDEAVYAAAHGIETRLIADATHSAAFRRADEVSEFVKSFLTKHR
jgi:pimeloyl-ACP methyl ester carboxylesterase